MLEMLCSLQLPGVLSNLKAFIYPKKFCLALQGGSLFLIQSPTLQDQTLEDQDPRIDVQLLSSWLYFSSGKMTLILYFSAIISVKAVRFSGMEGYKNVKLLLIILTCMGLCMPILHCRNT